MGVTGLPDLANLYKKELNIHNHPLIPFHGKYIDNACAIVCTSTETKALTIINTVKFDDCVIEWKMSDQYQVFLEMMLHVNEN